MRKDATSQYFRDYDIHDAAKRKSVRLKAAALLYTGKVPSEDDLIRTARYIQRELPTRVAHRIKGFHNLPFVVVTTPKLLSVMELYIRSFKIISSFNDGREVTTREEVAAFEHLLETLLDDHANVIEDLTQGFRDCHAHLVEFCDDGVSGADVAAEKASKYVQNFMDRSLTSRLGLRLLAQHHLLLSQQVGKHSRERIGIVEAKWKPALEIEAIAGRIRETWRMRCENPPKVKLNGHTEAQFPYIPLGVDYILQEIFKNSFRAVIESNHNSAREMPAIDVTIAVNKDTFTIRISDRGKGIRPEDMKKIWRYHFTTAGKGREGDGAVGDLLSMANDSFESELAGYGIGLPISKAYAEYLGGNLEIKTMSGIGTDVYLTLKHIDPHHGHSFRI